MTSYDFWIAVSIMGAIQVIAGAGFMKWLSHMQDVIIIIQQDIKMILRALPPPGKQCDK